MGLQNLLSNNNENLQEQDKQLCKKLQDVTLQCPNEFRQDEEGIGNSNNVNQELGANGYGLLDLPFELQDHIFSFLDPTAACACSLVCRLWKDAVWSHRKTLDLYGVPVKDDGLALVVQKCPKLQKVNLTLREITPDGVKFLIMLAPTLEHLDLSYCKKISDEALEHIGYLTNLKVLSLFECFKITDNGLRNISKLPYLWRLNLGGCFNITDAGLQHLSTLPSLQGINLRGCWGVTEAGMKQLARKRRAQLKVYWA